MLRWSLRGWLFFVSAFFAALVVGGMAVTTYVVVADGMQTVAAETTERIATSAKAVLREASGEVELAAGYEGLKGAEKDAAALAKLRHQLPSLLAGAGMQGAQFALFNTDDALIWASEPLAIYSKQSEARHRAVSRGDVTRSTDSARPPLRGLFTSADLPGTVVHTPVRLPGGETGVLDVSYEPHIEERVIDAIRLPMSVLALSAMLIMVVLMQTSMAWVLNLVDDLRKAADSIDAGRLDERLPDDDRNEIGELARSLNHLIERLQRRSDAQVRFVADASHELATPVAGIRGYTSILRAWGADDEKVREESIDAIDRESRRMARLTSDLLNLLHADQGLRLKSERFDLNVLVRERLAATASRSLDKHIEFVGPDEESLPMVGDIDRVEDVVSILLDNAAKYTLPGGVVSVTTARHRDEVVLAVSDTGAGIAADDLPRLFDRFFRSERARAEGELGFGLGLSIAKSMVDNMGGTIAVQSTLGEGSVFTVVLPSGRG